RAGPPRGAGRPRPARPRARVGPWTVTTADVAVGDGDGVIFLPGERMREIVVAAEAIRDVEERQAAAMRAGTSLRRQTGFADYLAARAADPALTFREHLRATGGAIEE
ncbi:RraA family protein, partial [Kitasatospora indigofera]